MVDFALLNAKMKADRERLAAMTPEARAEEEARARAERDAAMRVRVEREEDARLFGDRALRTEALVIKDVGGATRDGGRVYYASNAKGDVRLVIPEDRADEMARGKQQAAGDALNRAMLRTEREQGGNLVSEVPVQATGVFRSYTFTDNQNVQQKRWEFVASKVTFSEKGQEFTIGRDVHRGEPEKAAAPARKTNGKGMER
jgi:hypothetical protein